MKEDQASFGYGILSQGEAITTREHHRLVAKKAWLQLYDYLRLNDELFKARDLGRCIPWSLEEDESIHRSMSDTANQLDRFRSERNLREFILGDESHYDDEIIDGALESIRRDSRSPRQRWILDVATASNPKTILDLGSGYGEIAMSLGKEGYQVTGLTVNPVACRKLNQFAQDNGLPVQIADAIFEYSDFGDRRFDVVIAGEIIEHVFDDRVFVQRCADLANHAVVITTPMGSCEGGFTKNGERRSQGAHVRSYSRRSFERLIRSINGVTPGEVSELISVAGAQGQCISCFCACLKKEHAHDPQGQPVQRDHDEILQP